MKVRELQEILKDYHPDEDLAVMSVSNRFMQILGINQYETARRGMPVLMLDWNFDDTKPVETERDSLEREASRIREAIEKIDAAERKYQEKHSRPKGKRGRPKKAKTAKVSQDFSQSDEISIADCIL